VQIGIVSFGGNSCTKGYPIGFTALQKYLDWISNEIATAKSKEPLANIVKASASTIPKNQRGKLTFSG